MTYRSTKSGGLVHLCAIECATCGARTHPQPTPDHAWANARALGWEVPPASYRGPHCPDCLDSLLTTKGAA